MSVARLHAEYEANLAAQRLYEDTRRAGDDHSVESAADVMDALIGTFDDAVRWQQACRALVGQLTELRYKSASSGEQLRSEVRLFESSMDRVARIGADLVRLGLEDRAVKISERQTAALSGAIEAALGEIAAEHGFELDAAVMATVAKHLRSVTT